MRLTTNVLHSVEQRQNPLGDRELYLVGLGIPMIENLGADDYDALELSNNRLTSLENFPRRQRLQHLYLSNNLIETVDTDNLTKNVPQLETLILSYNRIGKLATVRGLATLAHLRHLSLIGNPICHKQYYRLYTIHCLPQLHSLDFSKIKDAERQQAQRLMGSTAGATLEEDVQKEGGQPPHTRSTVKTFVPGESMEVGNNNNNIHIFTAKEKEIIRQRLANATSAAEMQDIEASIRKGVLPPPLSVTTSSSLTSPSSQKPNE